MKKILLSTLLFFYSTFLFGQQFKKLLDFNITNGEMGYGNLYYDGTYLYGVTYSGGTCEQGIIFKIKPDGTDYDTLHNFYFNPNVYPNHGQETGTEPVGTLISDGTYMYGMTNKGGVNNDGIIYKIKPDGTGFDTLMSFNEFVSGWRPVNSLLTDSMFLYGMTAGGSGDALFKIGTNGSNYTKLIDFNGANGSNPTSSLISDGTYLYGMTQQGGTYDSGTVFKIKKDGSNYTKLFDFNTTSGASPNVGALFYDGQFLYGTTGDGGLYYYGTIFKIKPDGTDFTVLHNFNDTSGRWSYCSLVYNNNYLYGTTSAGGVNDAGIIYKIKTDGTNYTNLFNFSETTGASPYNSFVTDGVFLYGMTPMGGSYNMGTVYKFNLTCHDTTINNPQLICDTCNYTIGTHTYTTANTYIDTLHTLTGCDSVLITQLSVDTTNIGIQAFKKQNKAVIIYPNPANTILNIDVSSSKVENLDMQITDVLGNEISNSLSLTTNHYSLDISNLSNGIYFIKIGNQTQKFIKN